MSDYPLVTIGTLCYNSGRYVVESLECVKKQNYPNIELIIIDDCSTDKVSADLIQNYIDEHKIKCTYIRRTQNKGILYNLKEINEKASDKSKYLAFLSDDLWDDNFLHTSVALLEKSSENEIMLYSDVRIMQYETKEIVHESNSKNMHPDSENNKKLFQYREDDLYHLKHNDLLEFLFETNPIYAIGIMFKTRLFIKAGGFCDKYFYEDYPTWFKLTILGYDFLYYNKTLTTYVRHGANISNIRNKEVTDVMSLLKIENIARCKRLYTLKKVAPQLIYNYQTEGWFSYEKLKFTLLLIFRNPRIIIALISNITDKLFKIKRTY